MKISSFSICTPRDIAMMASLFALSLIAAIPLEMSAAEPGRAIAEKPMLDPWVPPALRKADMSEPTKGAALQEQVERKLLEHFNAADTTRTGTLTREQAQAAGLGYVVNNFDRIDLHKTGVVRFDDIKHFLRERGAQLN